MSSCKQISPNKYVGNDEINYCLRSFILWGYIYICRLACKCGEEPRAGNGSSGRKRHEQIDDDDDETTALISSLHVTLNSLAFHNWLIVRLAN